jgi:hypothetical protein
MDMNTSDNFFRGYLKDCMYCTNLHTAQEMQAKNDAVAEEIKGDMLCDTSDNCVVHLQQVHKAEGSHIECVYT